MIGTRPCCSTFSATDHNIERQVVSIWDTYRTYSHRIDTRPQSPSRDKVDSDIMAISAAEPGVKVTVQVDGQALHEYDDERMEESLRHEPKHLRAKASSKYIEAITGLEFAIEIELKKNFEAMAHGLVFDLHADVRYIDAIYFAFPEDLYDIKTIRSFKTWDTRRGKGALHYLQFAPLEICECKSTTQSMSRC
jgi:hypothetical protein